MRFLKVLITTLGIYFQGLCQNSYTLSLTANSDISYLQHSTEKFKDSISLLKHLQKTQFKAIRAGYLLASFDSLDWKNKTLNTFFHLGEHFNRVILFIDPKDLSLIDKFQIIKEKQQCQIPITPSEITKLLYKVHNKVLSNGYPFASVSLKKITYEPEQQCLTAQLRIDKGRFYTINAIHIKGDSSVSMGLVSGIIGIKKGDIYNESAIQAIPQKLNAQNYIRIIKSYELLFTEKGAEIFLYLETIPLSAVNGAMGLQPNTVGRYSAVGELNLRLLNAFKHGESVQLAWKSIQPQTQSLNGRFNYPFLFRSSFGIEGHLDLFIRDSTFLDFKSGLGISYFLKKGNSLKIYYQKCLSDKLSGAASSTIFTNLSQINLNYYGLILTRRNVDYTPNPTKGIIYQMEGSVGNRKSTANDSALTLMSTAYKWGIKFESYIPLSKRSVIRFANFSESYFAPEIYQNEVFRFGGLNSFRGFNEESLYATTKSVFSLEYRFLLDRNSALYLFYDQAFYENRTVKNSRDHPLGFGTGFLFGTKLGFFSMCYALGKQFDEPILIRNAKIHFGYVAYF